MESDIKVVQQKYCNHCKKYKDISEFMRKKKIIRFDYDYEIEEFARCNQCNARVNAANARNREKICSLSKEKRERQKALPLIMDGTKRCSRCYYYFPIEQFFRKRKRKLFTVEEEVKEYAMCESCVIGSRLHDEKRNKEHTTKRKKQVQEIAENPLCSTKGCKNRKCWNDLAYSKCLAHGGAKKIFQNIIYAMKTTTLKKMEKPKSPFFNAKISEIPPVDFITFLYQTQQGRCHYCGYSVEIIRRDDLNLNMISVDRKHSHLPYIASNVVIACLICNFGKGKSKYDDFKEALYNVLHIVPKFANTKYLDFNANVPLQNMKGHYRKTRNTSIGDYCRSAKSNYGERVNKEACTPEFNYSRMSAQQFRCRVTGWPLCFCDVPYCPLKPSVDRIDNSGRDYAKFENVQLTSLFMNYGRSSSSLAELYTALNERIVTYERHILPKRASSSNSSSSSSSSSDVSTACECDECTNEQVQQQKLDKVIRNTNTEGYTESKKYFIMRDAETLSNEEIIAKSETMMVQFDETEIPRPLKEHMFPTWFAHLKPTEPKPKATVEEVLDPWWKPKAE